MQITMSYGKTSTARPRPGYTRCVRRPRSLSAGIRSRVLLLPVMLLGIVATSPGVASADSASVRSCSRLGAFSARVQPPCWTPFSGKSPFNVRLPAKPRLASNDAAVARHMSSYGWAFDGGSSKFQITAGGSRAVYFASPSDPVMRVNCTNAEGPGTCQGANRVKVNGAKIHVPAGARPESNWDAHMTVVETETGHEYDFWRASVSGSTLTAGTGSVENVNTANGLGAAGDAAGFSLTAGLLRPSELLAGHINHPLVIDVPCTNGHGANTGYVWPAHGGWGESCGQYWNETKTGAPNLGQLFKLNMTDAEIASSGAPEWEQTIMTTLAHYGAYAEDTNGSHRDDRIYILKQSSASWTSLGQPDRWTRAIAQLGGNNRILSSSVPIAASKLRVVDPCVPKGTCSGRRAPRPAANRHPRRPPRTRDARRHRQHHRHSQHRRSRAAPRRRG